MHLPKQDKINDRNGGNTFQEMREMTFIKKSCCLGVPHRSLKKLLYVHVIYTQYVNLFLSTDHCKALRDSDR